MKHKVVTTVLLVALCLLRSVAWASTTWYVSGVSGSDSNSCTSPATACKTIGHAISLASSGDSIIVSAATYTENLTINISLRIFGSGASTTIIDGGGVGTVVTISSTSAQVVLARMTIRNGKFLSGGGIRNSGTLTLSKSTVSGNIAFGVGGGLWNAGTLTINDSTVSGNLAYYVCKPFCFSWGGGIFNGSTGRLTINNSTIAGNSARTTGGGIFTWGRLTISNTTVSKNSASFTFATGGIFVYSSGTATLQNSIVASNFGRNCGGGLMISNGYNLSSDNSCIYFNGSGDLNNTDPMLGPLQNNGGPTQTMALPSGSPAVDAGNPAGCTNNLGVLLRTDQRGAPRPDTEDTAGCDMGAFERQSD